MTLQIYIIIFYAVFKEQTIVTDCLNQLSYFSTKQTSCQILNGGDEEIRTPDPLLARQVLSQLSYAPMSGYAFVSIIYSKESVIFLKLYLRLAPSVCTLHKVYFK